MRVQHHVAPPAGGDDAREHQLQPADELRAAPRPPHGRRRALPGTRAASPTGRRPFALIVEPVETRSTIASASPSRGAASTEPETGTSEHSTPALGEQALRRDRIGRRDPEPGELGDVLLGRVDRHRRVERAAGEAELRERDDLRLGLGDEVRAGDPDVHDAVLGVLRDVARADEQQVDGRVRARDDQRALGHLEGEPGVGAETKRRLRHPPLRGDGERQPAVLAGAREGSVTARASALRVEDEAVAARSVPQPLRDAGHRRRRGRHALGDLEVGHPLLEQEHGLPPVRQRLQLGQRAEVAQEPPRLVARPQEQDGVGQRRPARGRARRLPGRPGAIDLGTMHVMLAC